MIAPIPNELPDNTKIDTIANEINPDMNPTEKLTTFFTICIV